VDKALERTRAAVERTQELRKSLLVDLLSRGIGADGKVRQLNVQQCDFASSLLGRLPSAWRVSAVSAEFELQNGFTLNANRRARFKRRPYLRVANFQRDSLDLSDVQELEADDSEFGPRVLQVDDLLVVEGHADRMQIGRCARVTTEASGMTFQNHLFRLRTKGAVLPAFATLWLNSAYAQRFWNARCATSSGLNTINQRTLKKLRLAVPPKSEQQAISQLAEQQRKHVDALAGRHAQLEILRNSLLNDLLTGRVRLSGMSKVVAS
jgi:type I restriction enzyme S subunit